MAIKDAVGPEVCRILAVSEHVPVRDSPFWIRAALLTYSAPASPATPAFAVLPKLTRAPILFRGKSYKLVFAIFDTMGHAQSSTFTMRVVAVCFNM